MSPRCATTRLALVPARARRFLGDAGVARRPADRRAARFLPASRQAQPLAPRGIDLGDRRDRRRLAQQAHQVGPPFLDRMRAEAVRDPADLAFDLPERLVELYRCVLRLRALDGDQQLAVFLTIEPHVERRARPEREADDGAKNATYLYKSRPRNSGCLRAAGSVCGVDEDTRAPADEIAPS